MSDRPGGLSRREFLRAGVTGVVVFGALPGSALPAVAVTADGEGFLTADELETLRGVVDAIVPEDGDPGALAGGCAEAIDGLLAAFQEDPPRIFAGGPFSDRAGSPTNDFADFLPLDPYEERAWRLRIEGSGGDPDLEFNGPVPGLQAVYREGLAACEEAAGGEFATLPVAAREVILRSDDAAITAMVDVCAPHTMEFLYGAPEYGGNTDLVGWGFTRWMGDVQPRGFTDEEVENPGDAGPTLPLPVGAADLAAVAGIATAENALRVSASGIPRLSTAREVAGRAHGAADALAAPADVAAEQQEHDDA